MTLGVYGEERLGVETGWMEQEEVEGGWRRAGMNHTLGEAQSGHAGKEG